VSNVDLSALRMQQPTDSKKPRPPLGPRLLTAGAVLLVLTVTLTFVWPLVRPVRVVRMAPVRPAAEGSVAGGTAPPTGATAEAVGWVEADPFATIVRPLVAGRVETLRVLEGDRVVADETIVATLDSAALRAAHERAEAKLAEAEASLRSAQVAHATATARLAQNAEPRLRVAAAQLQLAAITARADATAARAEAAAAAARGARLAATAQQRLADSGQTFPVALERARADAEAAEQALLATIAERDGAARERDAAKNEATLAAELAGDPVDLRFGVDAAATMRDTAAAALATARVELAIAERELGWATVRSPVSGIVQRLLAEPGADVGPGAMGLVALYDPAHLRARIDVPLDSIGRVRQGQQVEIRSEATGNTVVRGVVQRLQHESDLLKNTLQVKVGLIDAPPLLRPETLCRARFLADESSASPTNAASAAAAFRVPAAAVRDAAVFVFDPQRRRARRIPVDVLEKDGDDRIVRGTTTGGELSATHRVILDPVTDGEAVAEPPR
jgi:HlyD family secretion protein